MGLFGLMYTLFATCVKTTKIIKNNIETENNKQAALQNKENMFMDADLCMRYTPTGEKVMNYSIPNKFGSNDQVLKCIGTKKIVFNKTQTERERETNRWKELAIRVGGSAYKFGLSNDTYKQDTIPGTRFIDIKTNKEYVIIIIEKNNIIYSFYMDVETQKLVRPSDYCIVLLLYYKKRMDDIGSHSKIIHPDIIINEFNKENSLEEYNKKHKKSCCGKTGIDYSKETILELMDYIGINKIYRNNEDYETIKHYFLWDNIIKEELETRKKIKIEKLEGLGYTIVDIKETPHPKIFAKKQGKISCFLY